MQSRLVLTSQLPALALCLSSSVREYEYVEKGGAAASSAALNAPPHAVVKTLIFQETEDSVPFVVLQHGDASVDTKKLVRELARTRGRASGAEGQGVDSAAAALAQAASEGRKEKSRAFMAPPELAQRYTGYQVGGTSPFGLRDPSLRVFIEQSLLDLEPNHSQFSNGHTSITPSSAEHARVAEEEAKRWDSAAPHITLYGGPMEWVKWDSRAASEEEMAHVTPAWILINGGARGTLVALSVRDIVRLLRPIPIRTAIVKAAKASPSPEAAPAAEAENKA